ncbi:MAG TPA: hypothetical protein VGZ00_09360 [Candidatus Baltobacteraceae bacterium]|jgi:hypothetical protein|nr:hypothetical protein [Candidatus Baltobacteraceae bacterium]
MTGIEPEDAFFKHELWWKLNMVTPQRISAQQVLDLLAEIVAEDGGTFTIEDPEGTPLAEIEPDGAGPIKVFWRDCGTTPTPFPNGRADLVRLCGGNIQTRISIAILGLTADYDDLSESEFPDMERRLLRIAACFAERYPGLIFLDDTQTIYQDREIIDLAKTGKLREESWQFALTRARVLREKQEFDKAIQLLTPPSPETSGNRV